MRYFPRSTHESLLLVHGDPDVVHGLQNTYAVLVYGVLAGIFIMLVLRKLVHAGPRARRILAPLFLAAAVIALRAVYDAVRTFADHPPRFIEENVYWWQIAGLIALPLAVLAGFLRARLARASVGDLVVRLERTPPHGIRDELARALDDPTLEVALWLPERAGYVDSAGAPVTLPVDGPERAVTRIHHDGEPLAALVHDPTLREEPRLVDAAAAAARFALENARLEAELRAQLAKVQESRARIVAAGDEERRRIERNLHDGAQQRLVAIALRVRSAQRDRGTDAGQDPLLDSVAEDLLIAVEELRELAHGIHPTVLAQEGLAPALAALADRTPLPVRVDATTERVPPEVEAAAYFVACEALANVAKHAAATQATVKARVAGDRLVLEVTDDGSGDATPEGGSGLRGSLTASRRSAGGSPSTAAPAAARGSRR